MFEGMLRDPGTKEASSDAKFYFQQRRGRIDIRSISQIDVDRIVRDVDIDLLQTHLDHQIVSNFSNDDRVFVICTRTIDNEFTTIGGQVCVEKEVSIPFAVIIIHSLINLNRYMSDSLLY